MPETPKQPEKQPEISSERKREIEIRRIRETFEQQKEDIKQASKEDREEFSKEQEKYFLTVAEENPEKIFENFTIFYGSSVIEKAVYTLLRKNPKKVFEYSNYYNRFSFAEDILMEAAKKDPSSALLYVYQYFSEPYAQRIIEKAAVLMPRVALVTAPRYQFLPFGQTLAEKTALSVVHDDPELILYYVSNTLPRPFTKKLITLTTKTIVEKAPGAALKYAHLYRLISKGEEIIEKAAKAAAARDPVSIFSYGNSLLYPKEQLYAKEVFEQAATISPFNALHIMLYEKASFAADLVALAAEKDPWAFIDMYPAMLFIPENKRDVIYVKCKSLIEAANSRKLIRNTPEQIIEKEDFPMQKKDVELALLAWQHYTNEEARFSLITLPIETFCKIFLAKSFQSFLKTKAGTISYMNAFSFVQAVERLLRKQKKEITEEQINVAIRHISESTEKVRHRELFGPNTKLILFTHEEDIFNEITIAKRLHYDSGGKLKNLLVAAKGVQMDIDGKNLNKERVLKTIKRTNGDTTILFSGHGSPENWAFAENTIDNLDRTLVSNNTSINYRELGDALIASGNIKNINLIGAACFAYDYIENLFRYLEQKGVYEKPRISISEANKSKTAVAKKGQEIGSFFLENLSLVHEKGTPITVDHFFKAEGRVFFREDPVLFIGPEEQNEREPLIIPMNNQKDNYLEIGMGIRIPEEEVRV